MKRCERDEYLLLFFGLWLGTVCVILFSDTGPNRRQNCGVTQTLQHQLGQEAPPPPVTPHWQEGPLYFEKIDDFIPLGPPMEQEAPLFFSFWCPEGGLLLPFDAVVLDNHLTS